jgi:hypothetical protein
MVVQRPDTVALGRRAEGAAGNAYPPPPAPGTAPTQAELTRPPAVPLSPPPNKDAAAGSSLNPFSRMFQSMFGSSAGGAPPSPTSQAAPGGSSSNGSAGQAAAAAGGGSGAAGAGVRESLDGGKAALAVRDAPGANLVLWAESAAGATELERPYTHSTSLDGECAGLGMQPMVWHTPCSARVLSPRVPRQQPSACPPALKHWCACAVPPARTCAVCVSR